MTEQETVSLDDVPVELPPALEQFIGALKSDRKKLLKGKAFADGSQLQAFIGQFMYPRLIELVQMLGSAVTDTYGLSVSNANHMQRLHSFMVDELNRLGADLDASPLPGVSPEVMEEFRQAFYALGSVLKEKLPDDEQAQTAFNRCAELLGEMTAELMGFEEYDEDDEDEDEDDEDEGSDKPDEAPVEEQPVEAAASEKDD